MLKKQITVNSSIFDSEYTDDTDIPTSKLKPQFSDLKIKKSSSTYGKDSMKKFNVQVVNRKQKLKMVVQKLQEQMDKPKKQSMSFIPKSHTTSAKQLRRE